MRFIINKFNKEVITKMEKDIRYRPKLEALSIQLYGLRKEKKDIETDDKDLAGKIKDIMEKAGITKYFGKKIEVEVAFSVQQKVNVQKLSQYISLEKMFESGLLAVNNEALEKYIKENKLQIKPSAYLDKGKPYESVKMDMKK